MQKSNDFNDDSDDDLEHEPWDEDIDLEPPSFHQDEVPASLEEPTNQISRKKRSSSFFLPIFLIGVLGSGYYYYTNNTDQITSPPIVNLGLVQAESTALVTTESDAPEDSLIELSEQQNNAKKSAVLTPLPDSISDIQLPPLVLSENQEPPNESDVGIPEPIESIEKSPTTLHIEEQGILSRTEEIPDVQEDENAEIDIKKAEKLDPVKDDTTQTKMADSATALKLDKGTHTKQTQKPTIEEKISNANEILTEPPAAPGGIIWEIKGASPQRAVIYNKNSGETRSVEPGNTVKGLGRIKSISKENGKWVVIGTLGRAEQ